MAEREFDFDPAYEAAIRKLLTNWGMSANRAQLDQWAESARRWPVEQVETAVRRCIDDRDRTFAPKGFGEFAKYLPALAEDRRPFAWWSAAGEWGGDWSTVGPRRWLFVAATFVALGVCDGKFLGLALRRLSRADVEAAADVYRAGGEVRLRQHVSAWSAARSAPRQDQEALGV